MLKTFEFPVSQTPTISTESRACSQIVTTFFQGQNTELWSGVRERGRGRGKMATCCWGTIRNVFKHICMEGKEIHIKWNFSMGKEILNRTQMPFSSVYEPTPSVIRHEVPKGVKNKCWSNLWAQQKRSQTLFSSSTSTWFKSDCDPC